ncbi:MAG TPA: hypothetical protein VMQ44_00015 [Candidatus Saccharimonadales bacterium]|nr:hypothetical protein [Candidatus Saccharimonadales bacterium]
MLLPGDAPRPRSSGWKKIFFSLVDLSIIITPAGIKAESGQTTGTNTSANYQPILGGLADYPILSTAKKPLAYSKAYLLMDAQTGEVIASSNKDLVVPVASTTKMTTALVARQVYGLDDVLTVRNGPLVNGSKVGLIQGERITVESLLKGLLVPSGNDAAITLAEGLTGQAGDTAPYVTKMNEFLKAHNLTQTTFADPAGLDDDNGHSTAFELANIGRLVLEDPVLSAIVKTPQTTITSVDGAITHQLKNSNRLLQSDDPSFLPGTLGIKTGYTNEAGHCLVSAYTIQNHVVIGVVLNTNESTITASATEMHRLFSWAGQYLAYETY